MAWSWHEHRWLTFINSFKVAADVSDFTILTAKSTSLTSGTLASGTINNLNAADGVSYAINSQPITGLGQSAGYTASFKAPQMHLTKFKSFTP